MDFILLYLHDVISCVDIALSEAIRGGHEYIIYRIMEQDITHKTLKKCRCVRAAILTRNSKVLKLLLDDVRIRAGYYLDTIIAKTFYRRNCIIGRILATHPKTASIIYAPD